MADRNVNDEAETVKVEEWRNVPGNPAYKVSSIGRVRRETPAKRAVVGAIIKQKRQSNGYMSVMLIEENRVRRTRNVHRLVMAAFVGPCPNGKNVNHKNSNKADNRIENLEYVTQSENVLHAIAAGTRLVGEHHYKAKLSANDVRLIRKLDSDGILRARLAEQFMVSDTSISLICLRRTWKSI